MKRKEPEPDTEPVTACVPAVERTRGAKARKAEPSLAQTRRKGFVPLEIVPVPSGKADANARAASSCNAGEAASATTKDSREAFSMSGARSTQKTKPGALSAQKARRNGKASSPARPPLVGKKGMEQSRLSFSLLPVRITETVRPCAETDTRPSAKPKPRAAPKPKAKATQRAKSAAKPKPRAVTAKAKATNAKTKPDPRKAARRKKEEEEEEKKDGFDEKDGWKPAKRRKWRKGDGFARVIAFDIGSRNFACCIANIDANDVIEIEHLEVRDIIRESGSVARDATKVKGANLENYTLHHLTKRRRMYFGGEDDGGSKRIDAVVIENQKASKMREIGTTIRTFFLTHHIARRLEPPPVLYQTGSQKLRVLVGRKALKPPRKRGAASETTKTERYVDNKAIAVENCEQLLLHHPGCARWMGLWRELAPKRGRRGGKAKAGAGRHKQDDVADAALHAVFMLVVGNTTLPKGMKNGWVLLPGTVSGAHARASIVAATAEEDEEEEEGGEIDDEGSDGHASDSSGVTEESDSETEEESEDDEENEREERRPAAFERSAVISAEKEKEDEVTEDGYVVGEIIDLTP